MRRLLEAGNACIAAMDWRDMALVKLCLCAMGMLLGLAVPRRGRKWAVLGATAVFVTTYIPLALRFLPHLGRALSGRED